MKEAREDELYIGEHFYSIADVNSHYKGTNYFRLLLRTPGEGPVGPLSWARELTLECKVLPTFWKVPRDATLDCSLQTNRLLEAKPCSFLGLEQSQCLGCWRLCT